MKKTLLILCLSACMAGAYAQRPARGAGAAGAAGGPGGPGGRGPNLEAAYVKAHYTKSEAMIPMRDGVKLAVTIYSPKDQGQKYPFLMSRTPYGAGPYGDAYKGSLGQDTSLTREGFIFVYADVRGRYMSEGEFVNVRPQIDAAATKAGVKVDESTDTYDTIDWLVKNVANNNGRVGIEGISYPGFYSTASLPNAHPALRAVSPQAPVTEWFKGDDFHHKGVFFEMDAFAFLTGFGVPRPKPLPVYRNRVKNSYTDNYKFYLEMGALPNFKKKYLGDTIKFWDDMMNHPNYDSFWQKMNILPHLTNIKPAVLTVGGFFDAEDAYGAQAVYKAIEKQNNPNTTKNMLVLGPWYHGGWERSADGQYFGDQDFGSNTSLYFQQNIQLPFFNYYLKDKGTMDLPEASIFISGENKWHKFDKWPPANTVQKNIYLLANGKLSFDAVKTKTTSFDEYVSDPASPVPYQDGVQQRRTREYMLDDQRFAERRPDVKTYKTDVLTDDITLAGPVVADLFTSISTTDADYVVKLIDVFPDDAMNTNPTPYTKAPIMGGYEMLVRGEIFRGKFRNSYEHPEPFVPGKITEVKYDLPDVGHTFKKGHRIMIQIQSSWFPLGDRNPQQFEDINKAKDADFIKSTIKIYHSAAAPSSVKVTVLQ